MDRKNAPTEAFRFYSSGEQPATIAGAAADAKRKFEGLAYSGDLIEGHWYWGRVVFDLASTSAPQKLPMLLGHDRTKIVGFSEQVIVGAEIKVRGVLSSVTEEGRHVAETSDEGFPWQMSVHIEPSRVDEIPAGESVTVNGRTFAGPLNVFRSNTIREISFTPTGWDAQTSAVAMAAAAGDRAAAPPAQPAPPPVKAAAPDQAFAAAEKQAADLAARAQKFMQEARERGESLDIHDAMKLAKLPQNHVERVAFEARRLQHAAAERGEYLDAADAIHRARHWK